jgi:hypothetical protein
LPVGTAEAPDTFIESKGQHSMPLYHFVITSNEKTNEPVEPVDLPGMDAAWKEATTAAGEIIRDRDGHLAVGGRWQVEIQDGSRKPLRTIRLVTMTHE